MLTSFDDIPDVGQLEPEYADLVARHVLAEMKRIKADPLTYGHTPHEAQELVLCSTKPLTLMISGNRLGKSEVAMRETLWRARGDHPYKKVKLCDQIWVGIPGYKFLEETTLPHFYKWCPPSWKIGAINESKWYVDIRRIDGGVCRIYFKTFDQGRELWQGAAVGFIHLDEECPEEIYKEARARLVTTRGFMLITQTPVSGMGWLYDRLYLPGLPGGARHNSIEVVEGALAEYDEKAYLNIGKSKVPHLDRADIIAFAEDYPDPDEQAIRIFGQFRKRAGLIYKMFDEAVHFIEPFVIPSYWHMWGGVDPGHHGFAAGIWTASPTGRLYKVREFFSAGESTESRLIGLWKLYASARGWDPDVEEGPESYRNMTSDTGDTCAFFCDTEDPQTVMELNIAAAKLKAPLAFVSLKQGLKAVKPGILRMQQYLGLAANREMPKEISTRARNEKGEPLIYYFNGMVSTWKIGDERPTTGSRSKWELQRYTWKRPKKGSTIQTDEPDKESAGGAHMLDCDRYAVMARIDTSPDEPEDKRAGMDPIARAMWDEVDAIEERQLAELGMNHWEDL